MSNKGHIIFFSHKEATNVPHPPGKKADVHRSLGWPCWPAFINEAKKRIRIYDITDYGHMMARSQIIYSPSLAISQTQIENLVKCMKILAFCKKKIGLVLQNHGLRIHSDKI